MPTSRRCWRRLPLATDGAGAGRGRDRARARRPHGRRPFRRRSHTIGRMPAERSRPSSAALPGRVFRRSAVPDPPVAVRAEGSTVWDADGKAYLDGAGGAIVVGIGHGGPRSPGSMAEQAGRIAYAHGSTFTSEALEAYAVEVGRHLPLDGPAIYPVSGGSEAMETALKLARAYHLARGEADRWIVISRWGSYHGNTLGALDLSGRRPLRRPYEGWLGRFRHVSAAYPYRAGEPAAQALGSGAELAAELEADDRGSRPGHGRRVRRRADRRRDARRGRAAGRLLAGHRRRLPPPRRPPHRRRGHDRFRADRPLVRDGPLGRPAGHPRRGQGRDLGLLAVRLRGGVGRGRPDDHARPARSSTASPTATPRWAPRSRARCSGSSRRRISSPRRAAKGERLRGAPRPTASATTRTSATSAAAGSWSASSSSPTATTRRAFPRAARLTEAIVRARPRARPPRLPGDRQRRWRRRRPHPPRPAVRRHRRRARRARRPGGAVRRRGDRDGLRGRAVPLTDARERCQGGVSRL